MATVQTAFSVVGEQVRYRPTGDERMVEDLVADHACWSGAAPAGAVPGHAVVTLPGRRPALVPADLGFAIWLDGRPGVLHAFCP